ncbi:glycerophosphodiester phosphodiesterase [Thalassomonas viridans]|uniref:Glycerophosphodiester phosphodiesterase n=1 Tax=Thalassomonas viridans TaxID=137584 RepID=A0AAF0CEJ6_9GAMM|nr:glycerophosphodiester phosphodiesterase family protein [Thalassomonas viridans]WDE08759.1 glycerophosphodiester phosphodiesterase [Thalassomonas viridans]
MASNKQVIWISHRGLCQQADENTQTSFEAAVLAGFHYLETDLRASRDGHIVLSHDEILHPGGTTEVNVSTSSRETLGRVTLDKGSPLLFFDEFFSQFNQQGHVYDIKPETALQVIDLLASYDIDLDKTIFLLWSDAHQKALLKQFPGANCFARENECRRAGFSILFGMPFLGGLKAEKIYSIIPAIFGRNLFQEKIVDRYHQYDAGVLAYLPETREQAQMAIDAGVEYILSNHDFNLISP